MASHKDPRLPISHMLAAIAGVVSTAGADSGEVIAQDWVRGRALERGFEIISEASRRIPDAMKASEPEIPWKRIAGIGNVLRHDYDGVELTLLLSTMVRDLPPLEAALRRMLARL